MADVSEPSRAEPLQVGVNLLWCRPGKVGGSEEYLARQLVGLSTVAPDVTARLLVPPGFSVAHPELAARFDVVTANAASRHRTVRLLTEALGTPAEFVDVDVVHHAGGTLPLRRGRMPTLLTIHDVQYVSYPQYFSPARRTYLRRRVPSSIRQATAIAVPSGYVATTLIDAFGTDPKRIVVVPHGYEPPPQGSLPVADELRARYGLGDRKVLVYPAMTHPHKGHALLVELLAGPWDDQQLVLVLLGGAGAADASIAAAIDRLGVGDRVVRPGRVPASDRDGLIALAEALVFPSQYEGFGAPVLEAMALGTPVVCSDQAAVPEVAGDAAVVRQLTLDAWADALAVVAARRAELIASGHRRAAEYSVAASGRALAAAYDCAAGRR